MGFLDNFFLNAPKIKRITHIIQAILVLAAFVLGCALMADTSMQRSRSTTLILVYAIKSAIILVYQYLANHTARFQRFASLKAYAILNILECLFWFTAFIISCMGGKRCSGSSCALIGLSATVSILLTFAYFITMIITWRDWRHTKKVPTEHSVV
ncbi:hypothetical protein B0J11DRAFT_518059 [Dendryphion nanum]|uniref:MARVEL domain-containing protein n=1 Tax=Dendryphion nanum TaxID=256645 RepID=A0A9P9EDR6_9PLEO|nr:hypothetical protein B0J11DRAFT_518059 [Dendryphion nanum]